MARMEKPEKKMYRRLHSQYITINYLSKCIYSLGLLRWLFVQLFTEWWQRHEPLYMTLSWEKYTVGEESFNMPDKREALTISIFII